MVEGSVADLALLNAWKIERVRIVATLARRLRDIELAEDCVQEAYAIASVRWAIHGVPQNPGAWLTTTAWHQAIDVIRRNRIQTTNIDAVSELAVDDAWRSVGQPSDREGLDDEVFGMLLACCHPALEQSARVALTLRHVAGLSTAQIASAFLVSESTMHKRLVRARKKIREGGISFEVPSGNELDERVDAVRAVIYLIFTEGHHPSGAGPAVDFDLCDEAVWLAEQLHGLRRGDDETSTLLALLTLQNSRSRSRRAADGGLVRFETQDRTTWDAAAIERAKTLLGSTGPTRAAGPGRYQVEAAIALHHSITGENDQPDWATIAALYDVLLGMTESPVVAINRAVAIGNAQGAAAGLAAIDPWIDAAPLADYAPLFAAHAALLERAGYRDRAAAAWRRALELTTNIAQRSEIERRLHALRA